MKIPLNTTFKDASGEIITLTGGKDGQVLTMRAVMITACTQEFKEDQDPVNIVQEKIRRFDLYQQLIHAKDAEEIELSSELCAYLKPRVARCFGIIVCGPALQLLDGKTS